MRMRALALAALLIAQGPAHAASVVHSLDGSTNSTSNVRRICVTNLPISMMEMFLPMHVRAPWPNYTMNRCQQTWP